MKMIDLFSGIGGISLAAEWAGIETVAFCENEPFCQKVLAKHWPDVTTFDDVRTLTKEKLIDAGVIERDGTIDIVCGGYPCQPFSLAGNRKGTDDPRHLWPEMFRIVKELRPTWVVGENVAGHITMGLDDVLSDLESEGYQARSFIFPAAAVGARHRRDRVFAVAYSDRVRGQRGSKESFHWEPALSRSKDSRSAKTWLRRSHLFEPKLCRSLNEFPGAMDRLRALGNAVSPNQIYPILKAIADIERGVIR